MSVDTDHTVLHQIWSSDHRGGPSAPARGLPMQPGPFAWNPVIAGSPVPVGGWAKLTRRETGSVQFTGHFYVPGAPIDVTASVLAVRAGVGTLFTFVDGGFDGRFARAATSAGKRPTLWWRVRVVSTDAFLANDVAAACRCACRWSTTTS